MATTVVLETFEQLVALTTFMEAHGITLGKHICTDWPKLVVQAIEAGVPLNRTIHKMEFRLFPSEVHVRVRNPPSPQLPITRHTHHRHKLLFHFQPRSAFTYDLKIILRDGYYPTHPPTSVEFWNDATHSTETRRMTDVGGDEGRMFELRAVELRPGLHAFKLKVAGCVAPLSCFSFVFFSLFAPATTARGFFFRVHL